MARARRPRPGGGDGQERLGAPEPRTGHGRRLSVGNAHRNAMLESLAPEQQPIAQQLLRGGIPAVRTALHFERERARDEGRPEPSTEGVLAIAEALASRVKAAEWRDRAEAAVKAGDELPMRDLRSLVSGSDVARDEASRPLAVSLREMLDRRVEGHRTEWANDVSRHLDEGHVLRALRLSSRPPDTGARFSAELATRLRDAAGAGLAPPVAPDKWLALLAAVAESPVRRAVKPAGMPERATPEVLDAARQQAGRVPGLAPLLGLAVPPPPGPARPGAPVKAAPRRLPRPPRGASSSPAPRRASPPPAVGGPGPSPETARASEFAGAAAPDLPDQPDALSGPEALDGQDAPGTPDGAADVAALVPAELVPAELVPAELVPADEVPADEVPADEVRTDEVRTEDVQVVLEASDHADPDPRPGTGAVPPEGESTHPEPYGDEAGEQHPDQVAWSAHADQ